MSDNHILIAFLATLASIVVLVVTGAIMAAHGRPAEALGIGGAVTGLIGLIGTFKPRPPGPLGTAEDPVKTKQTNTKEDPANVQEVK